MKSSVSHPVGLRRRVPLAIAGHLQGVLISFVAICTLVEQTDGVLVEAAVEINFSNTIATCNGPTCTLHDTPDKAHVLKPLRFIRTKDFLGKAIFRTKKFVCLSTWLS